MSREAYVAPTSSTNTWQTGGYGGGSGGAGAGAGAGSGSGMLDSSGPTTQYMCGDCASKVLLKKGDPIRCKECGHRVLYKERTKRMVQFEAR